MGDLVKPDTGAPPSRKELQYLSHEMTREWLDVARYLKISEGYLYSVQTDNRGQAQESIYQMLLHWKQKGGQTATRSVLAEALKKYGRADLSEYILTGREPAN